jgi:hypothetical protein
VTIGLGAIDSPTVRREHTGAADKPREGGEPMRARIVLASGLALVALAGAAPAPPASDERYAIAPTEGGYLRIDKRTGEIAMCRAKDAAWACEALDDRKKLESEVARLANENKELQGIVKRLEELVGLPNPDPPAGQKPKLPVQLGKAMQQMGTFVSKLKEKWKEAEERRQALQEEQRRLSGEEREPARDTWRETRRDTSRESWQDSRRDTEDRTFWNDRRGSGYDDRRGYRRDW